MILKNCSSVAISEHEHKTAGMKRIGNLYQKIGSKENLEVASVIAKQGKKNQYGVLVFNRDPESRIEQLAQIFATGSYQTSEYQTFEIHEPKLRIISRLPFFPDRIGHHAIMQVLEPEFVKVFTADTYSCIKGRGIHKASYALRRALRDQLGTKYCLKMDIKKFYPSIDHDVLKSLLRRKFKDPDLLKLLDEIIDSAPGVPIGNYLSQYFANYYLTYFDHWVKETLHVKHYFRYCDDLVMLSDCKKHLNQTLSAVQIYLQDRLKLEVKSNHQIFPVSARGIDFVGYVHFHSHVRLRKSIKKSFARAIARNPNQQTIASYMGWVKHCDSRHLLKKLSITI